MRHAVVALFRAVWEEMTVPEEWLLAHIVPIYKKAGARSDMRNYRPIALMSIMAKMYEAVLNVRLTSHLEKDNRIGDEQAGFRAGRSCIDHVFVLSEIIADRREKALPTYLCFLDLSKEPT